MKLYRREMFDEDDDSIDNDWKSHLSPSIWYVSYISLSMAVNVMKMNATFGYLFDYLKHFLWMKNRPMNFGRTFKDIFSYIFFELESSVNTRASRNEIVGIR